MMVSWLLSDSGKDPGEAGIPGRQFRLEGVFSCDTGQAFSPLTTDFLELKSAEMITGASRLIQKLIPSKNRFELTEF